MFGFSDATVKMLIQELPNAKLCNGYKWQDFDTVINDNAEKEETEAPPSPSTTSTTMEHEPTAQVDESGADSSPYNSPPSSPERDTEESLAVTHVNGNGVQTPAHQQPQNEIDSHTSDEEAEDSYE
jgi:hypothetical protein